MYFYSETDVNGEEKVNFGGRNTNIKDRRTSQVRVALFLPEKTLSFVRKVTQQSREQGGSGKSQCQISGSNFLYSWVYTTCQGLYNHKNSIHLH